VQAAVAVADFAGFRREARLLLAANIAPENVAWEPMNGQRSLLNATNGQRSFLNATAGAGIEVEIRIPRRLASLLEEAACHCRPMRWSLLYRLLWRATRGGEANLLDNPADPDLHQVQAWAHAVAHEVHKMHAFVRFRRCGEGAESHYVAWYEPRHSILRRAAPFFVERFAAMRWALVTPQEAAQWDKATLSFTAGPHPRPDMPEDGAEALWQAYYARIFNPARLNAGLMRKHVPRRYWHNLPEMRNVEALAHEASRRVETMRSNTTVPPRWSERVHVPHPAVAEGLHACNRCPLWQRATQAVEGEGPVNAEIMLVGEQPGDEEDLQGKPFVGPAGKVLDRALAEAGLARKLVYLTNAVKHFKWEPRGKRRLHKTPAQQEAEACRPWLEGEIARARPRVIVALGSTAAHALAGEKLGIAASRGRRLQAYGARLIVTYHPSAVLRASDGARHFEALREDLELARRVLEHGANESAIAGTSRQKGL
jgi:DNA polymerase